MIVYAKEHIATIKEDISFLIQDNYDEVEIDTDKLKLMLDWDSYEKLQSVEMLHIYTARLQGIMVGYLVMVTTPSLHCLGEVMALSDVVYVAPKHRVGNVGTSIIKYAESDLHRLGASTMHITTKAHAPFDKLLERQGFTFAEKVFQKYIGIK